MKKFNHIILSTCLLLVLGSSCRKEEALNVTQSPGLGGDTSSGTAIDKWILDSLTMPYNISSKYKWDPFTVSLYKTLTPPDESKVIPLLSALRQVWINPYNA